MHIKFLNHGAGDAARAARYVLGETDHLGIVRAGVDILRGDLDQFAAIANSLTFKERYSSGVISWAAEDDPTPQQIAAVLDDMEQTMFAGLEPNEYIFCAVIHEESDGAKHVHLLIPKCHLPTGKHYNPAPPGWQKTYDPLRDKHNMANGWARPDDPARARLVQPGHEALIDAAAVRAETDKTAIKPIIERFLAQRVAAGEARDRAGILAALGELGEITRAGKDYVSIKPEGFDKPIRLKGELFNDNFQASVYRAVTAAGGNGKSGHRAALGSYSKHDKAGARKASQRLEEIKCRRAEANQKRYGTAAGGYKKRLGKTGEDDPTLGADLRRSGPVIDISNSGNRLVFGLCDGANGNIHENSERASSNNGAILGNVPDEEREASALQEGRVDDESRKDAFIELERLNKQIRETGDRVSKFIRAIDQAISRIAVAAGRAIEGCRAAIQPLMPNIKTTLLINQNTGFDDDHPNPVPSPRRPRGPGR